MSSPLNPEHILQKIENGDSSVKQDILILYQQINDSHQELKRLRKTFIVSKKDVVKIVNDALRNTIDAHGSITKEWIGSASKRIVGQIQSVLGLSEYWRRRAIYAEQELQRFKENQL